MVELEEPVSGKVLPELPQVLAHEWLTQCVLPALAHPDPQLIFGAGRCVLQLAAHPVLGGVQPGGGDSWSERPVWAAATLSALLGLLRFRGDAPASRELLCRPLVTCMGWVKHADFVVAVSLL
jgi:hypothetical protein